MSDIRITLIKFMGQLELSPQRFGGMALVSLLLGVLAHYVWQLRFGSSLAIPLLTFLLLRDYIRISQLIAKEPVDASFRTLRASGVSEGGYLLASALLIVGTLLITTGIFALGFAATSLGWYGAAQAGIIILLLLPWLIWLQYYLNARVMRVRDRQMADSIANYGLIMVAMIVVWPSILLVLISPSLAQELLEAVTRAFSAWPLITGLSWLAFFGWLIWLSRRNHSA